MRSNPFGLLGLLLLASLLIALPGCGDDDDDDPHFTPSTANSTGQLAILATDAPPELERLQAVFIRIGRIEARTAATGAPIGSATAGAVGSGDAAAVTTAVVLSDSEQTIDLLQLRGGVTQPLVTASVPAGTYPEVALLVTGAEVRMDVGGTPRTYSTANGTLQLSPGARDGTSVTFSPPIVVVAGRTTEAVLDFDLLQSLNILGPAGEPDSIVFDPIVRGSQSATTGRIAGLVRSDAGTPGVTADDVAVANAAVTVTQAGLAPRTAVTDPTGVFVVPGLSAGPARMEVLAPEHDVFVVPELAVTAGGQLTQDVTLRRTAGTTAGTGRLVGNVRSDAGTTDLGDDTPLSNAQVTVTPVGGGAPRTTVVDLQGNFVVSDLGAGPVAVRVEAPDHAPTDISDVTITSGADTTRNVTLRRSTPVAGAP